MKITHVEANRRKKAFDIQAGGTKYEFPFAKLRLEPSAEDPVEDVFVDPELGCEAFTYRLRSGREDTVHLDAVLGVVKDPDYLQDLLLHRLAVEAKKGFEESGLSKRQVARQLGTSPSQLYRLLDPANRRHSIGQILALLDLVGKEVEVAVRPKATSTSGSWITGPAPSGSRTPSARRAPMSPATCGPLEALHEGVLSNRYRIGDAVFTHSDGPLDESRSA